MLLSGVHLRIPKGATPGDDPGLGGCDGCGEVGPWETPQVHGLGAGIFAFNVQWCGGYEDLDLGTGATGIGAKGGMTAAAVGQEQATLCSSKHFRLPVVDGVQGRQQVRFFSACFHGDGGLARGPRPAAGIQFENKEGGSVQLQAFYTGSR